MENLPTKIKTGVSGMSHSGLDFVSNCIPDFFSTLFTDLNLSLFPRVVYTGPEHLHQTFSSWTSSLKQPMSVFNTTPELDQAVFWKIPQSDIALVFDSFLHITNRFVAIRKLISKIDPGGCVVVVSTHSPVVENIERDARIEGFEYDLESGIFKSETKVKSVLDMYIELVMKDFEKAGMKWIKRGIYKNRVHAKRIAVHDEVKNTNDESFNIFEYSARDGLSAQKSPFIAMDKALEKVGLSVMIFQKPSVGSQALIKEPLTDSVFGQKGLFATGDRRVDYFIDDQIRSKLSPSVLNKIERVLSWSFSRLKQGIDYDCFSGRSAYITLVDENGAPSPIEIGDYTIRSIKLKGATFDSGKGFDTFDAVPDSMLSFDEEGLFFHTNFDDKPMGSMTFGQATNEFKVMKRAVEYGVLTDFPIGICCFPDILFQNKKTGAAIIGVNEVEPSDKYRFFAQFNELLGHTDVDDTKHLIKFDAAHLPEVVKVLVSYGQQLRHFHDAGLLHVLGHNNQISIRGNSISFHDFEYSLLQDGMSLDQRTAYRIQDLRRALCGIKIYKSGASIGFDFKQALLSGYFFDESNHKLFVDLTEEKLNDKLMLFFKPAEADNDSCICWMREKVRLSMEQDN